MIHKGILKKMSFTNSGSERQIAAQYWLDIGDSPIDMNAAIGNTVIISFTGRIECLNCGRTTKNSFGQGYCYPCFTSIPQTEACVLRPELCQAHLGIARDMDFARKNCLSNQYVYLALSGGLKVGVTREHQIPTRWVDQGATRALPLLTTPNRHSAGLVEVDLKTIFADKTNWRNMLRGEDGKDDLLQARAKALEHIAGKGFEFEPWEGVEFTIRYPITEFPAKVTSLNLTKTPSFTETLKGIKGQYLILSNGKVINIRSHSGFEVEISVG